MKHYTLRTQVSRPRRQSGIVLVTSVIFLIVLSALTIMALQRSLFEEKMAGNDRDTYYAREAAELALRDAERDIAGQRFDGTYCSTALKASCGGNLRPAGDRPTSAAEAGNFWVASNNAFPTIGSSTVSTSARPAPDGSNVGWYNGVDATTACGKPLWQAADWDTTQAAANKCTATANAIVRTTIYGEFTGAPTTSFAPGQRLPRYLVEVFNAEDMGIGSGKSQKVYLRITAVGFGRLSNFGGNVTSVTLQSIYSPL